MEKIQTGSDEWIESLIETLICSSPFLIECAKCGSVINERYVCHCGYDNSYEEGNEVYPEEWLQIKDLKKRFR